MKNNILKMALALTLSSCSIHPPAPPTKEEKLKQFVHCFREEMAPTDEQIAKIQSLFKDDPEVLQIAKDFDKEGRGLEEQLENPAAIDKDLEARFQKVNTLKGKMAETHFKRMLLLRSTLSDDQKKKFLVCKRKLGPPTLPQD